MKNKKLYKEAIAAALLCGEYVNGNHQEPPDAFDIWGTPLQFEVNLGDLVEAGFAVKDENEELFRITEKGKRFLIK